MNRRLEMALALCIREAKESAAFKDLDPVYVALVKAGQFIKSTDEVVWLVDSICAAPGLPESISGMTLQERADTVRSFRVGGAPDHGEKYPPGAVRHPMLRGMAMRNAEAGARPNWVVNDLLEAGDVGMLVALPGVGKTLTAIELARAVAMGDLFGRHQCKAGKVLYLAPDDQRSAEMRMSVLPDAAQAKIWSVDCEDEQVALDPLPAGIAQLETMIDELSPALVVIDTLDSMRASSGSDFSQQDDLYTKIFAGLRAMAKRTHCVIVVVHHTSKSDKGGLPRGSGVIEAKLNWRGVVEVDDDDPDLLILKTGKIRDGVKGEVGRWRKIGVVAANGREYGTLLPVDGGMKPSADYLDDPAVMRLVEAIGAAGPNGCDPQSLRARGLVMAAEQIPSAIRRLQERGIVSDKMRLTKKGRRRLMAAQGRAEKRKSAPSDDEHMF